MKFTQYLLLLTVAACATKTIKDSSKVSRPTTPTAQSSESIHELETIVTTSPVVQETAPVELGFTAPTIMLPSRASSEMQKALQLFTEYANSDEFYTYVRNKVPRELKGGNETDRDMAILKTRVCLSKLGPVNVTWKNYGVWPLYKSAAIGGWDGIGINQNPRITLTHIERAGHWYHELLHACKFTHVSNNIKLYPIIRNSWPYQGGYAFEDFLEEKETRTLAGAEL